MTDNRSASGPQVFPARGTWPEASRILDILRKETVGGTLLAIAAAAAIILANSPWSEWYFALRDLTFGYAPWHLELSLGTWAADGLLAIFFFLVGLELKREFVAGDLRNPATAVVPVLAAAGGVAVPALIYAAVNWGNPELLRGWAIPTATDIAFAVAVLALIGSHLPSALRIFLLTLAVVDDLIAITIIAVFYTDSLALAPAAWGAVTIAAYALLAQLFRRFFRLRATAAWLILLPLGVVAWGFVHASGIHATIAGVLLGFTVPVLHNRDESRRGEGGTPGLAEVFEHRFRPLSAGIAVPVFAFFAAGVRIPLDDVQRMLADPVLIGVVAGLVIGKPIGIVGTTWLLSTVGRIRLNPDLRWGDLMGVGLLAGIGFTVSLLVAELSFPTGAAVHDDAKAAILLASVLAAMLASLVLLPRNARYKQIRVLEETDADADGVPDIDQ